MDEAKTGSLFLAVASWTCCRACCTGPGRVGVSLTANTYEFHVQGSVGLAVGPVAPGLAVLVSHSQPGSTTECHEQGPVGHAVEPVTPGFVVLGVSPRAGASWTGCRACYTGLCRVGCLTTGRGQLDWLKGLLHRAGPCWCLTHSHQGGVTCRG